MTLYQVVFRSYNNSPYRLDTTDPAKIGPWLAEMYGLFPYQAAMQTSVNIEAITNWRPSR